MDDTLRPDFNKPLTDAELEELESDGYVVENGRAAREIKRLRSLVARSRLLVKDAFCSSWGAPRVATDWLIELEKEAI